MAYLKADACVTLLVTENGSSGTTKHDKTSREAVIAMDTTYAARLPASSREPSRACRHEPPCPAATTSGRLAARIVASHPEQGWSLLCNGIITFEDGGTITPGDYPAASQRKSSVPSRAGASQRR